jgi:uridylate kinase
MRRPVYHRVVLKLSGETLAGGLGFGFDEKAIQTIVTPIVELVKLGVQIGIVAGGGNIFRGGRTGAFQMERSPADQIGMLATEINAIMLQEAISSHGVVTRVMSARGHSEIVEEYSWREALQALDRGEVVLFSGGTGNSYFTTDSNAALRASQMRADILLKATKVDGIYDKDPVRFPEARRFEQITYQEVLERRLEVMDLAAISLCLENQIPIKIFSTSSIFEAVTQSEWGTLVS